MKLNSLRGQNTPSQDRMLDTVSRAAWYLGRDVANGSPGGTRPHSRSNLCLTPATGALLGRTVISLGSRGNKMEGKFKKQLTNEEQEVKDDKIGLEKLLNRHEHLINSLAEFIKGKMNVHGEIRRYVASLGTSYKSITRELEKSKSKTSRPTSIGVAQTSPTLLKIRSETTVKEDDYEDDEIRKMVTPKCKQSRKGKRKKRTSPEEDKEVKKLRGEASHPAAIETISLTQNNEEEWRVMQKKKKPMLHKAVRPNAVIIRPKEKENYAEILKRVKQDASASQVRDCVDKIRRTTAGDMLIVLRKEDNEKAGDLQKMIANLLGEEAIVVAKSHEEDLEIKDLDETTTKQEIVEALQKAAGDDITITLEVIKSLRKAYGGTQVASLRLNAKTANKVIGERGKIKVGWVNCRIRRNEKPAKCFRCWQYGHYASKCGNEIDRTNLCMKCGGSGHKIADCKKDARCTLCKENGNTEDYEHVAGSSRCPVFKKALQMLRNNRPL